MVLFLPWQLHVTARKRSHSRLEHEAAFSVTGGEKEVMQGSQLHVRAVLFNVGVGFICMHVRLCAMTHAAALGERCLVAAWLTWVWWYLAEVAVLKGQAHCSVDLMCGRKMTFSSVLSYMSPPLTGTRGGLVFQHPNSKSYHLDRKELLSFYQGKCKRE